MKAISTLTGGLFLVCLLFSSNHLNAQKTTSSGFTALPCKGAAPLEVHFVDLTPNNTVSWQWEFEGGIPAKSTYKNPVVIYKNKGTFSVTLIVKNESGYDTIVKENFINVEQGKPIADFEAINTEGNAPLLVEFEDKSTNEPTAWIWDFVGGTPSKSNKQNPVVTYKKPGKYAVKLIASNSAGANTIEKTGFIEVKQINGVLEYEAKEVFEFYPNPCINEFVFESKITDDTRLQFFDLQGRLKLVKMITYGKNKIDISPLSRGIYLVVITTNEKSYTSKLSVL